MSPVLLIRHVAHEGPGFLQYILDRENIPFVTCKIDQGDLVPKHMTGFSGLVLMGGPMSVNDPLHWLEAEINLTRQAINADFPVLGHCLGGQIIAKALDATVQANPVCEIGWHPARKILNEMTDLWLSGLGEKLNLFHWHCETFDLPAGATPILTSKFCQNQAFVIGKTLALQCHIEMTEEMVLTWCEINRESLCESDSVQTAETMIDNLNEKITDLNQIADCIYSVWLKGIAEQ